jgi:hypothetical protein
VATIIPGRVLQRVVLVIGVVVAAVYAVRTFG